MNTGLRNGTDQYTYWSVPRSVYVTLTVLNNGVDVAFGNTTGAGGAESANYPPNDEYLTPGALIRPDNFDAIRIKNHVAGAIAQYSISTRLVEDVPSDIPLGASFTPTYLSVDAQGNISANFTGHLSAQGIDFPPGTITAPASQIRWVRGSNGALIAQIFGQELVNAATLDMVATAQSGDTQSTVRLDALSNPNTGSASLQVSQAASPLSNSITANIATKTGGSLQAILLREDGSSDYLQTVNALGELTGALQVAARGNLGFSYPFSIYNAVNVSMATASMQAPFASVDTDPGSYLTVVNGYNCFQAPADGWYLICGQIEFTTSANNFAVSAVIQPGINLSTFTNLRFGNQLYSTTTGGTYNLPVATLIHLTANQIVTIGLVLGAINTTTINGGASRTFMQAIKVY